MAASPSPAAMQAARRRSLVSAARKLGGLLFDGDVHVNRSGYHLMVCRVEMQRASNGEYCLINVVEELLSVNRNGMRQWRTLYRGLDNWEQAFSLALERASKEVDNVV